jgi:hypothetical protein
MSGYLTPPNLGAAQSELRGTDDELSSLLGSIRRHVLDAPPDVWEPDVRDAAKMVSAALADKLKR